MRYTIKGRRHSIPWKTWHFSCRNLTWVTITMQVQILKHVSFSLDMKLPHRDRWKIGVISHFSVLHLLFFKKNLQGWQLATMKEKEHDFILKTWRQSVTASYALWPKNLVNLLTPDSRHLVLIFPQHNHIQDPDQFSSELTNLIFDICSVFSPPLDSASTQILYGIRPRILEHCSSLSFFNASENIASQEITNFPIEMPLS